MQRRRHYFIVVPFVTYVEAIKKVDVDKILTENPAEFYNIVLDYFRGDREAAYFFIDYIISCLIPGEIELKEELITYMRTGNNEKAKSIMATILEKARKRLRL
ncbi:hypothetical protein J4526_06695 [Desulfurococcaceae archaeon MEX13E-LK6-19]|nr:hypothetical protein J4526_06695 [Desulfurococcaceae archaeon MEX13E-LK6-19]